MDEPQPLPAEALKPTRQDKLTALNLMLSKSEVPLKWKTVDYGISADLGDAGAQVNRMMGFVVNYLPEVGKDELTGSIRQQLEALPDRAENNVQRAFVELSSGGLAEYLRMHNEFRGGGKDSILPEGAVSEPKTVSIGGREVKKYLTFWDYEHMFKPGEADYYSERWTYVNQEAKQAMRGRVGELKQKITEGTISDAEMNEAFALNYLAQWAEKERWDQNGRINQRQ